MKSKEMGGGCMNRIRVRLLSFLLFGGAVAACGADFGGWAKTMPITFSGYGKSETLTNFPCLVTLGTALPGFSYADFASPADGADLRFAAGNQIDELNYEIEKWDTNGSSYVWVQVPALVGTNTQIWAYWNKPGATAPACATNGAAWSAEFRGVWHMTQANVLDATTNANTGAGKNGITTTNAGLAGNGLSLLQNMAANGSNYVDFGTGLAMGTGNATLSIWFKTATNALQAGIIGKSVYASAERYSINGAKAPNIVGAIFQTTTPTALTAVTNTPWTSGYYDNQWHQLTATFNRTGNLTFYVDGAQKAATNISAASSVNMTSAARFLVGAYGNASGTGPQALYYFPGLLDEGRLMRVPVSSNWVWAAWLSAASNATFSVYGTAENIATSLTVRALSPSAVGATNATVNGVMAHNGGEPATEAYFCWDYADKGTATTGAWAHVEYAGNSFTNGQSFALLLNGLPSGSTCVYRCYATNSTGAAWSSAAPAFTTVYVPSVTNPGPVNGYLTTWLRGQITDAGLETPSVWFYWWPVGGATTNVVPMGQQGGVFSNVVSGLTPFATYQYSILASNLAGAVWSSPANFQTLITYAEVVTYTGVNTGRWEDAANWDLQYVPTPGNDVVIPNRKTVTLDANTTIGSLLINTAAVLSVAGTNVTPQWRGPLDTTRTDWVGLVVTGNATLAGGSLAIGGLNQKCPSYLTVGGNLVLGNCPASATNALVVYAGPTNAVLAYSNGGARVTVGGATTVGSNSWVYPYCHQITGAPVVFDLQDLTVSAAGAGFDAVGRGYSIVGSTYYGPGAGIANYDGGSYGGLGGNADPLRINGFRFAPYKPGSPGYVSTTTMGMGGGAIRILARTVSLTGKLLADGQPYNGNNTGAGSGGGIWVTCSNFVAGPGASVSAKGGDNTQQGSAGGGGGGRIAIMTDAPTGAQLASLYATGTCDDLIVVTTNMADPVLSPYPALANVAGGLNTDSWFAKTDVAHGKPGTAVWLRNKGDDLQVTVWGNTVPMTTTPAYGVTRLPSGESLFSAVSPGFVPNSRGLSRLSCTGYSWSNGAEQASGSTTSVAINVTSDTSINWSWGNLEHLLTVRSGGKGAVVQDYSDWNADGSTVTLTVQPEEGCSFLYWIGDVPYADRTNASLTLTMNQPRSLMACFTAPPAGARSLVWAGGISTNDWFDPANWDNVAIPGVYDSVTITNGTNLILYPAEITVGSLALGKNGRLFIGGTGTGATALTPVNRNDTRPYSLTVTGDFTMTNGAQMGLGGLNPTNRVDLTVTGDLLLSNSASLAVYAGYKGATTDVATYQTGGAGVTVGGGTYLGTNCWIHPFCHQVSGAPVIFNLQNLAIATNAGFNADYRGFGRIASYSAAGNLSFAFYGPGKPNPENNTVNLYGGKGGSYGGVGGGNSAASGYGYTNAPFWPGSPGGSYRANFDSTLWSGGAIRILAQDVQLNGQLNARGYLGQSYSAGNSGGGIWVTCSSFAVGPGALLNANGGTAYNYSVACGGGGGGRIAVALNLSPGQISDLYASGSARGLVVQPMASSPYAANYSVAGGPGFTPGTNGAPGSAVFIMNATPPGTVIMMR